MTDHLAVKYKNMVSDFVKFFKGNQGSFKGERRTYTAKEGTIDEPSKRVNSPVQTTVSEKMAWFVTEATPFIDAVFDQEATNASGKTVAELVVYGKSWGTFSSLELLKLKSILDNPDFKTMYASLPTRSESKIWENCDDAQYKDRTIFQTPLTKSTVKTTTKESYILEDPNIDKHPGGYKPTVAVRDTIVELGEATAQEFSGEISLRDRALIQKRIDDLRTSVIAALKKANETDVIESNLKAEKLFAFIHANE